MPAGGSYLAVVFEKHSNKYPLSTHMAT